MEPSRIVNGLKVQLVGGPLDGDSFELLPTGSVLPPQRLSYLSRDRFPDGGGLKEHGCWLHYECKDHIPEWSEESVKFAYVGKEKLPEDR